MMTDQPIPEPLWSQNKYLLLFCAYTTITAAAFLRINRQPYSASVKWEQYETVFKGTSLAAVIAGVGMSGRLNRARSKAVAAEDEERASR